MSQHAPPEAISIHFWTPCHATPYYSMLHRDVSLHQLDCSPANSTSPLGDESSRFRANPLAFLRQQYKPQTETTPAMPLPSHAVVFSSVLPSISTFVSEHQFSEVCTCMRLHAPASQHLHQRWCCRADHGYVVDVCSVVVSSMPTFEVTVTIPTHLDGWYCCAEPVLCL